MDTAPDLITRHVQDLAETWQSKVLRSTCEITTIATVQPKTKVGAVVLSILAHGLDAGGLAVLLKAVFPDFYCISAPFYCSAAKIDKRGHVVADAVLQDNHPVWKNCTVFSSLCAMETALRRLADRLQLSDTDRLKLFTAARAWVVADRRLDPAMDPRDPDARRLTVH